MQGPGFRIPLLAYRLEAKAGQSARRTVTASIP